MGFTFNVFQCLMAFFRDFREHVHADDQPASCDARDQRDARRAPQQDEDGHARPPLRGLPARQLLETQLNLSLVVFSCPS